jgi:hypothetical protein
VPGDVGIHVNVGCSGRPKPEGWALGAQSGNADVLLSFLPLERGFLLTRRYRARNSQSDHEGPQPSSCLHVPDAFALVHATAFTA